MRVAPPSLRASSGKHAAKGNLLADSFKEVIKMREDLIGAKAYKIGYKAVECGDRHFTCQIVKTFEEAMEKLNQWKALGWYTKITAIK